MTKQEEETALLHQQASTKYLQGEFEQALAVWRKLLQLDPGDERAQEGVRLCEMLADEGDSAASATACAPASPSSDGGGIDELQGLLDPNAQQASAAAPAAARSAVEDGARDSKIQFEFTDLPEAPELPDPDRQGEGIDAGDVGEMATLELAAPGSAAAAAVPPTGPPDDDTIGFDLSEIDAKLGGAPEGEAAPAQDAAAYELSSRIRALNAQALEAHRQGNPEEAVATLARLFILDENDPAGRELEQTIRSQMSTPEPVEPPSLGHEPIDPGPVEDQAKIGLDFDSVVPTPSTGGDLDRLEDAVLDESSQAAATPARTVPTAPSAKPSQPPLTKILIAATVVTGLAAAGFYLAPKFLGGGPARPAEPSAPKAAAGKNAKPDASARADGSTDAPARVAATLPPIEVERLLSEGQAALDEARYADAVLAYKRIIDANPQHEQARQLLRHAGERYREEQERLKQWENAIAYFNDRRYQDALKAFYRLPQDEDPERLERYQRNGWFNLGLQSLRSGACSEARSHFKEARVLDPDSPEIQEVLELCDNCLHPQKEQSYFDAVASLRDRALED